MVEFFVEHFGRIGFLEFSEAGHEIDVWMLGA